VDELKRALQTDKYQLLRVKELVEEHLDELDQIPSSRLEVNYPDVDLEEPITIQSSEEKVEDIVIEETLEMNSGLIFVGGKARCDVLIDGFVYKSDAYGLEEEERVYVSDWHWNEHYAAVQISDVPLKFEFSFTFDRKTGRIDSFEFLSGQTT
jgi:hypothetical protein